MAGTNAAAYDREWDKTIPDNSPEIARIMREKGVGRRRATHLLTRERAESIDVSDINVSQKELVLTTLVKHADIKNNITLGHYLRKSTGIHYTDGHDVVKMLWACQKMGWVTFRERKSNGHDRAAIYAIKLTTEGYRAAAKIGQPVNGSIAPPIPEPEPPEDPVADLFKGPEEEVSSDLTLAEYPHIVTLLGTANVADKLEQASELLEQAGEDEMALQVIAKVNFSPLEKEVIHLSRIVFGKETDF